MARHWVVQAVIIIVFSAAVALGINAVRNDGIALLGNWPSRTSSGEGPVTPPSAQPGDLPFIKLDDAAAKFQSPEIGFIDARLPEDYADGHIVRAVNIPFDNLDDSWNKVIDSLDHNREYVVYCSGEECEASLFLGRLLSQRGFAHIAIFFGGWTEWQDNGLPISRGEGKDK
jgi:rhodanese-related sulfurtransferase